MTIKQAVKFIFLNASKIIKLSDDGVIPAIQLIIMYKIWIQKKEDKSYYKRICQLCKVVKNIIEEKK